MSESEAVFTESDLAALKALQTDSQELERLEKILDRFNVFETIGFIGQEVMHSRFLAFLLDPKQNHGLGDVVLRKMLEMASVSSNAGSVLKVAEDIGSRNMEQTAVQTEVYTDDGRIDILLLNEVGKWAVIIENKVWSTEHSDQLDRYYQFVKKNHPRWDVFGIYLTPFGDASSHQKYLPLDYTAVCKVLDDALQDKGSMLTSDVRMSIEHYTKMVRRNIVGDEDLTLSCSRFYWQYRRALDLVYKHRFAQQEAMRKILRGLIEADSHLVLNSLHTKYPKEYVAFGVRDWDVEALSVTNEEDRWTGTGRILLFVFGNFPDRIDLSLQIGPGDEATRRRLLETAHDNPAVFKDAPQTLNHFVTTIFSRPLLPPSYYEDASDSEREREIHSQWAEFLQNDLPRIDAALKKETWIWESTETEGST